MTGKRKGFLMNIDNDVSHKRPCSYSLSFVLTIHHMQSEAHLSHLLHDLKCKSGFAFLSLGECVLFIIIFYPLCYTPQPLFSLTVDR